MSRVVRRFSRLLFSFLPLLALLFVSSGAGAQTTYTWNLVGGGNWTIAANWTPTRTAPAANDIMVISTAATFTITNVPTQTIARLTIQNSANVILAGPGMAQTLTVGDGVADAVNDFSIAAGAALTIASSLENIVPAANALGDISGTLTLNRPLNLNNADIVFTVANGGVLGVATTGAVINSTATKLAFNSGATYQHGRNNGDVPLATWDANSNCNLTGVTTGYPTGMGQTFGNVSVTKASGSLTMSVDLTCLGDFTHTNNGSGIFNTAAGTPRIISIGGDFTNVSGHFRLVSGAGSSTMNVGGDFNLSGGLFTGKSGAGTALLEIAGNYVQTGGTFDQRAANVTSTSVVTVGGDFNLSGGIYDISGVNATGSLNVAGDFSHTVGTLTETGAGAGNGVITFNGSAMQAFTTTGWAALDRINFILNNSGAGVTLNSPLTINANASLTFTDGILTTDATNLLTFSAGATVSAASNASHVNGPVEKTGTTAFVFPVGDGTNYKPVGLSAPSMPVASNTFRVTYFDSTPMGSPDMMTLMQISGSEYWDIERTAGTSSVSVTLNWAGNDMAEVADIAELRVAHFIGGQWVSVGGVTMDMDPMAGGMIASGLVSSFSPFTLGSTMAMNALPIELLSFTATPKSKTVQLNWRTATELNNAWFQIERSANGRDFAEIGKLAGAGTSQVPLDYAFTDALPLNGWNYYRLRQLDTDGGFSFSPVQAVLMGKAGASVRLQVFPNPTNNELNLKTTDLIQPGDRLEIYDYTGRQVQHFSAFDAISAPVDVSQLPAGTYLVRLRTAEGTVSTSFVKQ